jgi:hypothetical protein
MPSLKKFEDLLNHTVINIRVNEYNDEMIFVLENEEHYRLYHVQDCCEHVAIEDICGDLQDLLNTPLRMAEEISNLKCPFPTNRSHTWTFYKLATAKGYVTIRWLGTSSGHYSEKVSFARCFSR